MTATVTGVGVDLVHIPSFADQMDRPGTAFETVFTPGERSDVRSRGSQPARHYAVRWAAKEAVIKAWSASIHGQPPVMEEHVHHLIEVVTDAWDRPRIKLQDEVAKRLTGVEFHLSLSHDGDYAMAYVVMLSRYVP